MGREETPNAIILDPEPSILIESLRDIGYSFESALADIIDNSITAEADDVQIYALPVDDFKVAIIDDGQGLSKEELLQAMKLGSTNPRSERKTNDLGRFGLGMKTASFSQCRKLTVVSRKNTETTAFTWDLDLVVNENKWHVIERDDIHDIPCFEHLGDQGTLIVWEKVDRLTGNRGSGRVNYERVISEAQEHLQLVFHRYLSGEPGLKKMSIAVNGRPLIPLDPFNSNNKATQTLPIENVAPGVTLQAYTLPHRSNYDSEQEYEKYGLPGGYLKNQGVYIYRAKRLIFYGTWFGLAKKTSLTQLSRVKIDIDNNQDELWKIDVKKVSAQMPEAVRERVATLARRIGAPSKKVYKRRGARLTSPDVYPTWTVERSGGKNTYRINRNHPSITALLNSSDEDHRKEIESVLSLIEASFPKESLYYDLSNDAENVEFTEMQEEAFKDNARTFFSQLKQTGKTDEVILSIMGNMDIFSNRWNDALDALDISEE